MLNLDTGEISDIFVKDLFQRLQREANINPLFGKGMVIKEYSIPAAVTQLKLPHGLSFQPKDIILTSKLGPGSVTINYDKTDDSNIYVTTTGGAVTIRVLLGRLS